MSKLDPAEEVMIRNIEAKTGKGFTKWLKIAKAGGSKHAQQVKFLQSQHGLTFGYATFIVHKANASDAGSQAAKIDLVAAQYAGDKAALRLIYDRLEAAIRKFGADVEFAPKKAYVSLRRKKQFGCLQPSTATRFDVGLILKGVKPGGRLELSGSWNTMVTHRVRMSSVKEVDQELIAWLKQAYDAA